MSDHDRAVDDFIQRAFALDRPTAAEADTMLGAARARFENELASNAPGLESAEDMRASAQPAKTAPYTAGANVDPVRQLRARIMTPLGIRSVMRRLRRYPAGHDDSIDVERVGRELHKLVAAAPEHVDEETFAAIDQYVDSYVSGLRSEMYERYSADLNELDLLEARVAAVSGDDRSRLEHMDAAVAHALDRLSEPDPPHLDPNPRQPQLRHQMTTVQEPERSRDDTRLVLAGNQSRIAGRPMGHALMAMVLLAAVGADFVAFHQILVLVVPNMLAWVTAAGFSAVSLLLAREVGRRARQAIHPRKTPGATTWGWISFGMWWLLGTTAFLVRYLIGAVPGGGSSTAQHLSGLLFVALYVNTGAVAAVQGFFQQDPAARQFGLALRWRAKARARLAQAEQVQALIEAARQDRLHSWELSQQQCYAAAVRLKQQARLWVTAGRGPADEQPREH
ncbi:MAG TPA: hypothetical protein VJT31_14195 [Rugosimonospora sp.]|nr:hypothetical protein [Rugosimonospora sp.]